MNRQVHPAIDTLEEKPGRLEASGGAALAGFLAAGLALAASGAAAGPALAASAVDAPGSGGFSAAASQASVEDGQRVAPAAVEGSFAWTQAECTANAELARNLYGASKVLCGSGDAAGQLAANAPVGGAAIASIAVTGDVANEFVADVAQMNEVAPAAQTLGCSCAGNPVDGRASGNAAVEGFKLSALIAQAQPLEEANTLTFVCADGYEVAMPLIYARQHYALVVSRVNGEACSDALGCANQLWLGGNAARAFARDIGEVRITAEAEVPAMPGASEGANLPNVSVLAGAEVA